MARTETRLLLLAPRYPYPALRGDQGRVLNFLRGLAEHCTVRLLTFGSGPPIPVGGISVVSVTRGLVPTALENIRRPDPRLPVQVRLYLDATMRRVVAEHLRRFRPHVIHATLSRTSTYLPPCGPWHRHLDLVDPASVNMRSRAQAMSDIRRLPFAAEALLTAAYERRVAAMADTVTLVSELDRARAPGLERAVVIPIGVDEMSFPFREPVGRKPVVIFFGNLGYFHNIESARYAAQGVMPLLRSRLPSASMRIVGARPSPAITRLDALDGVTVVGPVSSMAEELHQAAVALLPIMSGSGMQNKILEAFSAGTPVVSTAAAIRPVVGAQHGRHCLVGETASELADACAALLSDHELRLRIAAEARRLAAERYGIKGQAEALLALYGRN